MARPPARSGPKNTDKYKGKAPNKFQGKPKGRPSGKSVSKPIGRGPFKGGPKSTPAPTAKRKPDGKGYSARPVMRISLSNIKHNYEMLDQMSGRARVGACVKADAYGLGMVRVARALYGAGCRTFFVAHTLEGRDLREAVGENASIYVLCGPAPRDLTHYFASDLKPVINSLDQAKLWSANAEPAKRAPFCALHFDTGMNRLGLDSKDTEILSKNKPLFENIGVDLLMSHLACAGDAAHPLNADQLSRFQKITSRFPVLPASLANTAGIYLGKSYHFNLVRPGIGLYGGAATTSPLNEKTRPVVTLDVPILQIRDVKAGQTVGYDAAFTAKRDTKLATLSIGYGDGLPVSASSNRGDINHAMILGQTAPIIGRVSMDLTTVDITDIKGEVAPGMIAEFLGEHLADDARAAGTINYELLTRLGRRFWRDFE